MWNKIRYKLAMFLYGRNGLDDLNKIIFVFSLIWMIVFFITGNRIFDVIYLVHAAVFLFRALSKNLPQRRKENDWVMSWIRLVKTAWKDRKGYVVYRCSCGRIVRIPRHRGKVEARCPGCTKRKIINTGKKK